MTLGISIDRLLESVYATSALATRSGGNVAPILHRGHEEALRRVARDAFALTCASLLPYVSDIDIDGNADIMTMEADCADGAVTAAMAESAVAYRLLSLASTGIDNEAAARYEERCDMAVNSMRMRMAQPPARVAKIEAWPPI